MLSAIQNQTLSAPRKLPAARPAQEGVAAPSDSFESTSVAAESPSKLRQAFDNLVNIGGPGKARLLDDNLEAWNERWRLVESAKDSINCQYFCFDNDAFGMALMGFLYKKAKQDDVDIRLMLDATGDTFGTRGFKSHIGGKDYVQELVETGNVEAKVYHPHWKKVIDQVLNVGSTAIAASNHDKILEVDGERGLTGGRNIGYEYFVHPQDFRGAWRDTDISFEGKATAHALRDAFDVEFGAPWVNQKVNKDWLGNWVKRDAELIGAYCLMDSFLKGQPIDEQTKHALRTSEEARKEFAAGMVDKAAARLPQEGIDRDLNKREFKKMMEVATELASFPELAGSHAGKRSPMHEGEVKILDKTSSVGIGTDDINRAILDLSRAAEKRIVIENPYVVLTDSLIDGFKEAGKRGVEIWLGTNSPSSTDSATTQAFFLKDWPKLEATIPNLKIFTATGDRKLHAKVAVIDDKVSLVGSYNLDFLSQQVNSEIASVVWSKSFATQTMDGILRDHADPNNAVVQYKIARDSEGNPVRSDGLPVLDAQGELLNEPEIEYGPEHHLTREQLDNYKSKIGRWSFLRKVVPHLKPLDNLDVKGAPAPTKQN